MQQGKKIFKGLILDLGGVIYPSPLLPISKLKGLDWNILKSPLEELESGKITRNQFIQKTQYEILLNVVETAVSNPNLIMLDILDSIRAKGEIKIGVVTNDWNECFGETINDTIRPRVHSLIRSHLVGKRKPEKEIFKQVLDELNVKAEECIYLDDIGTNLKAAREMNITTIKCETKSISEIDENALNQLKDLLGFEIIPTELIEDRLSPHFLDSKSIQNYLLQENTIKNEEEIISIRKFKQGQSNPTYVITIENNIRSTYRRLVLRQKPENVTLPTAHRVDREYRLLTALKSTKVPVPLTYSYDAKENRYFMEMVESRNIVDPNLPFFSPIEAKEMYSSLIDTLLALHEVEYENIGLHDFGRKPELFFEKQLETWSTQNAQSSEKYNSLTELEKYLRKSISEIPIFKSIIHGDFRIDNVLFHPVKPKVVSILDVELSTIGNPLSDVSLFLIYHQVIRDGFLGAKPRGDKNIGIPSDFDLIQEYLSKTKSISLSNHQSFNWNILSAFNYWKIASIFNGVYSRSKMGNASSKEASKFGIAVPILAKKGLEYANKTKLDIRLKSI